MRHSFSCPDRGDAKRPRWSAAIAGTALLAALLGACDGGDADGSGATGGSGAASGGSTTSGGGGSGAGGSGFGGGLFGGSGGGTATGGGTITLPDDFVEAEKGGFALGDPIQGQVDDTGVVNNGEGCNILVGVVRDFRVSDDADSHPDFQSFSGEAETKGLVDSALGADKKPVYASQCEASGPVGDCPYGAQTTSKERFDEWYRSIDGTNKPYLVYLQFEPNGAVSTFESHAFFPLDNAGFGNYAPGGDDSGHNYHFTTELHTKFKYQGGETFGFEGDDDLWVFINGVLAIDLGGLHPGVTGQVDLDQSAAALGIEKGNVYSLELFHAERATFDSNFRVDTNLAFVDCGEVVPEPE